MTTTPDTPPRLARSPLYARQWRPPLPYTQLEQRLYDALDWLHLAYQRQAPVGAYRVDALVQLPSGERIALEADGCVWHYCPRCGETDPRLLARLTTRDAALARLGLRVLHVPGHAMQDEHDAIVSVRQALAPWLDATPEPNGGHRYED